MKEKIKLWQFMGFAITSLFGTVLHFLYDLSGGARWLAPFSGVNESTWEHMKLLFWPMLLFALVQSFFFREIKAFPCIKLRGMLLGLGLIPVLFYTYNGVIGKSPDWINITIFFVSAAIVYLFEAHLMADGDLPCKAPGAASGILIGIALLFVLLTFWTPEIGIFKDPLTGTYGLQY